MPLKPWEEFAVEPLAFPIAGKTYVVPPLGYKTGLLLQRTISGADKTLANKPPEHLWRAVLGTAFDDMVKDNVPIEALARAGFAALTDFQQGREAAEKVWESGIDPEALAAAVTAAKTSKTKTLSPDTAEEPTTLPQASTSGTRTSQPS